MKKIYFLLCLLASISISAQQNITFSVDMTGQTFTQAYVSGSFNSWSGDSNPLTDMGSGIWEVTLPITDGEWEYKFTFDNWTGQEAFTQGDVCTITNYGNHNRRLVVAGADQTLATAPFGVCAESATNPGPHNVTFNVDMTGAPAFTQPYISGEFNGWAATDNPLTDSGDGVNFSITLPLTEASYQFKIQNDAWATQEGFNPGDPGTATDGTFTNRYISVDQDKTVSITWNAPQVLNALEFELSELQVYPNPSKDSWNIKSNQIIKSVFVYDVLGKQVISINNDVDQIKIDASQLTNGLYFAKVLTISGSKSIKLIKE